MSDTNKFVTKGRRGQDKAVNFGMYIKQFGWTGKWSHDDETGITHLYASRGESETIDVWWPASGSLLPEMLPVYTLAGEKIKCRNVSAIAQIAAKEADTTRLHKAYKKLRKQSSAPVQQHANPKYMKMADDELEKLLLNKTVTWVNSISGELQAAEVIGKKTLKVMRNGRDQVHFVDSYGFHAVYLDAIVSVK